METGGKERGPIHREVLYSESCSPGLQSFVDGIPVGKRLHEDLPSVDVLRNGHHQSIVVPLQAV